MSRPWLGSRGGRVGSWGRRTGRGRVPARAGLGGAEGHGTACFVGNAPAGWGLRWALAPSHAALASHLPRGSWSPWPKSWAAGTIGGCAGARGTGRTWWPLHEQPFLPPSRWALGGFARERASTASLPRPHTDGARPPPGLGRLQASALSGELASHLLASLPTAAEPAPRAQGSPLRTAWKEARDGPPESHLEDLWGEESQCPRGSRSTCVGVGGGQLCGGGGVLRSPEVLTPMPGALSGVSSRLGVIRPLLPAEASRRLRQPSVTGIPATWARAAPETPLVRRLRRAAANTCGGRGPAPRSAQASPAARPEQLITPAPGREALPGPLFSTCLPGACE